MSNQLTSRAVALAAAGINLAVCAALVTVFLLTNESRAPDGPGSAAGPPVVVHTEYVNPRPPDSPFTPAPSSTARTVPNSSTPAIASDFRQVSGPGGMSTAVPVDWPLTRAAGPGAMQATDPADENRYLRYGGSPVTETDTYPAHEEYQNDLANARAEFRSFRLERTVLNGAAAIDWEFEFDADEGRRHVRSVYWVKQGHEYFVYASSLVGGWPQTQPILDVMISQATP